MLHKTVKKRNRQTGSNDKILRVTLFVMVHDDDDDDDDDTGRMITVVTAAPAKYKKIPNSTF